MKIDLAGISVMIAMPVKGSTPIPTTISLLRTVDALARRGINYDVTFQVDGNVEYARSKAAHEFLQSPYHRLFWIDADMEWTPDDFLRVLALSMKMDIVGAVYTARCDPPKFFMNFEEALNTPAGQDIHITGNEWGCIAATGFGLGFTCCSRFAMQTVTDVCEKIKFPLCKDPIAHIFACDVTNGEFVGEDMAFFARARRLGIKVHFDPTITLGHVGLKTYSASFEKHLTQEAA